MRGESNDSCARFEDPDPPSPPSSLPHAGEGDPQRLTTSAAPLLAGALTVGYRFDLGHLIGEGATAHAVHLPLSRLNTSEPDGFVE